MKKKYLLGMTLMASLAFYSCSKDNVVDPGNGDGVEEVVGEGSQVLTLQVSSAGDGLTTRAGRPLLSSEANQNINHVVLYVVGSDNKVVLKKTIGPDEWKNAVDYAINSGTNGQGKQIQITFSNSKGQKLANGNYTIYAVAYYHVASTEESSYKLADTDFGLSNNISEEKFNSESSVTLEANNFKALLATKNSDDDIIAADKIFADEIFAGKIDVTVTSASDGTDSYFSESGKKDTPNLVLNRQVAGVTGYFTNIAAKVGETEPASLRLIASSKSNTLSFTSMVSGETNKGSVEESTSSLSYTSVVNGKLNASGDWSGWAASNPYWNQAMKKGYLVYQISLSDFFQYGSGKTFNTFAELDVNKDGYVGYLDAQYYVLGLNDKSSAEDIAKFYENGKLKEAITKNWKTIVETGNKESEENNEVTIDGIGKFTPKALNNFWKNPNTGYKQSLVIGSVFAGNFIIPFQQTDNVNTLELQLLDTEGNILRAWNVAVPKQVTSNGGIAAGINGGSEGETSDNSTLVYNIYRNHLYSLGLKESTSTDPTDPTDPTGPENPEDLSKGQNLEINVNDNWEVIHHMVID